MKNAQFSLLLCAILLGCLVNNRANAAEKCAQHVFDLQIYRITTNITGNGLTSQTLPGAAGSFQIIHEKLDDIELVMEGETLTWNGSKTPPNHPGIELLSAPSVTSVDSKQASISIRQEEPLQYFEQAEDGRFDLRTLPEGKDLDNAAGIKMDIEAHQEPGREEVLNVDLAVTLTWVQQREKIKGITLDVGKPILETKSVQGTIGAPLNAWVCYRQQVPSRGFIYIFLKASKFN